MDVSNYLLLTHINSRHLQLVKVTTDEMRRKKQFDCFYSELVARLKNGDEISKQNEAGVLFHLSYRDKQIKARKALQARILRSCHYATLSGNPGDGSLYYFLCHSFYWPSRSAQCNTTVRSCVACAENRVNFCGTTN